MAIGCYGMPPTVVIANLVGKVQCSIGVVQGDKI